MKDFPVFTTEFGAASLILKEIPYRQIAYIHLRDTQQPKELLEECVSFCRICGAEKIYAAGHPWLEHFPLHTAIWEMRGMVSFDPNELPKLWPVNGDNVSQWRDIYNRKMRQMPNAGTLEARDEKRIVDSCGAYFIHDDGLIGIGWLDGERIEVIASMKKGSGAAICKAMQSLCPESMLTLEVASANEKAVRLYESLGFLKTRELSRWYQVL